MAEERLKVSRLYTDFDLSFEKNPITSDLSKKTDVNAVKQSLKNIMMTNHYETPFDPTKGANLRGLLFRQADAVTARAIRKTIEQAIVAYEPRVSIDELIVNLGSDELSYRVTLRYTIVGIAQPQTLTANLERLR